MGEIQLVEGEGPTYALELDGTTLTITVDTYGSSCYSRGPFQVTIDREIRRLAAAPYDWRTTDGVCEHLLMTFQHSRTIELGVSGLWTVVLTGRGIAGLELSVQRMIEVGS